MLKQPTGSRDDDIHAGDVLLFQSEFFLASHQQSRREVMVGADRTQDLEGLHGEFAGGGEDDGAESVGWGVLTSVEFFEEWNEEGECLSAASPRRSQNIPPLQRMRNTRILNIRHGPKLFLIAEITSILFILSILITLVVIIIIIVVGIIATSLPSLLVLLLLLLNAPSPSRIPPEFSMLLFPLPRKGHTVICRKGALIIPLEV
mmetsp:Transcript_13353/g.28652  ORF Transcript_13353/g.28652 Transcript_13353/m.28652 type:complete len:204 (-) Transcript_13353:611-1222(-)